MKIRTLLFRCLTGFLCIITQPSISLGQPGNLDSGFNGTGQYFSLGSRYDTELAFASALQPDGKLLVAGGGAYNAFAADGFVIRRYTLTGQLDIAFGQSGQVFTDFNDGGEGIFCMAIQEDSKILVGGVIGNNVSNKRKGILARYESNGSPDLGFGLNGKIITNYTNVPGNEGIFRLKLLPDGKILVMGYTVVRDGLLAKYKSNGLLDSSFGTNGLVHLNTFQIGGGRGSQDFLVQPGGRILVSGYNTIAGVEHFEISRYLANGQLDLSFNDSGYVNTFIGALGARGNTLKQQPDAKVLVLGNVRRPHGFLAGHQGADFVIVRYHSDGTKDESFGENGIVITNFYENDVPSAIEIQPDGKILVSGSTFHIADQGGRYVIARYLPNGTLDDSFAQNGTRIYDYNMMEGSCIGMHLASKRIYLPGWANGLSNSGTGFNIYALQNDIDPVSITSSDLCPSISATTLTAGVSGSNYKWQESGDGIMFTDLENNNIYQGTTTPTLLLNNIPSSWYGRQFRCLVGSAVSNTFTLRVTNAWAGTQNAAWENPANWSCGSVPDANTAVTITNGMVFINSHVTLRSLTLHTGAILNINPGYILTVTH